MTTTPITPEPGTVWECRIDGGSPISLIYLPGADPEMPWTTMNAAMSWSEDDVTVIRPVTRRITDEGGHWEPCTREAYARTHGVRFRVTYNQDAVPEDWERWVPDAPPVTVPTVPGTYGIATGRTECGSEFTNALCWIDRDSDVGVHLPDGRADTVYRHRIDKITAWRTIPAPGAES